MTARFGILGLVVMLCGLAQPLSGQQYGAIHGVVRNDVSRDPLEGVEVRVGGMARSAITGADGRFSLAAVPVGERTVEARRLGFAAATSRVVVSAGTVTEIEFVLGTAPVLLDHVAVTASRSDQQVEQIPAAITIREADRLRSEGFAVGTDEFRGVPGVSFRRGEGDGDEFPFVSFRGSPGTDGYLALLDGIPFVGIFEEPLPNQMPYDALDRIEVVKGPLSALYGRGALYGAVNYITRSPRTNATRLEVTGGSDDFYRGAASIERTLGARSGLLLDAAYEDYGGWRDNGGRRLLNLFGKFETWLGDRTTAAVYANWSDRDAELPNGIPLTAAGAVIDVPGSPEAFAGYGTPANDLQVGIAAVRLSHALSADLSVMLTAQARRVETDNFWNFYDPFGFDASRSVYAVNGFRGDSRHDVGFGEATLRFMRGRHDLIAGFAAERSRSREANDWTGQFGFTPECGFAFFLIEIDYTTGQVTNRNHPCWVENEPFSRSRVTSAFWGAFVRDEVSLSRTLHLALGARYDAYRRTAQFASLPAAVPGGTLRGDADALSARGSLSWRYGGGQVYTAVARGFNSNFGPTFEWNPAEYARPENKPSTIDSYEIGWKARAANGRVRWETALFLTRQTNRRNYVPNPDPAAAAPPTLITFGQRYDSRGAEVTLGVSPGRGVSLAASYAHVDAEWGEYVVTNFAGTPTDLSGTTPRGIAPDMASLAADVRVARKLDLRAALEWYGDYQVTEDNSFAAGGHTLFTLGARMRPGLLRESSIDLVLTNVLDEKYYSFFGGRSSPSYATPGVPRQMRIIMRSAF
jgi:outer membrane receptor protein involved in Fe transport